MNRIFIGHDIGRRFLDIEPQLELRNGGGGDALDAEAQEELLLNSSNANPTETAETENCNNTTANNCNNINSKSSTNSHSSSINHKKLDTRNHNGDDATGNGSNGDEGVECLDSREDNGPEKSSEDGGGGGEDGGGGGGGNGTTTCGGSADELVLDVLNDDLIAQVRTKLNSGGKDIFAQCVNAVKSFLAGEPFREFENSMYFHR